MKKTIKHILVIRLSAMGDVAMTVPVLRIFRETYPEIKVTVLTRKFFIPLFNDISGIEVYPAEVDTRHKGILGLAKLFRQLNNLGLDAVADLHSVLRSNILKLFFVLKRIKVVQIDKGRAEKKALTKSSNKTFKPLKSTHQRYADVFDRLGFPIDISNVLTFENRVSLTPKILALTGDTPQKWMGIAPFAQYEGKTYPLELMKKVIEELDMLDGLQIFLFGGGKKELEILNAIASTCNNVCNVAGKLLFEEELVLIANLDIMLSMDSGNAHLSAMYGVPTVTIWGVTHPYAGFMAFGQPMDYALLPDLTTYNQIPTSIYGNKVPAGYDKVMYTIDPETVIAKVKEVLE